MILSGSPNLLYKLSQSNFLVSSAIRVLWQGMRITPFKSPWSTTTKSESNPSARGRSVIRSIKQCAKGPVDIASLVDRKAGCEGFLLIFKLLALTASLYVVFHKGSEARPLVMFLDQVISFQFSRMSSHFQVMIVPHKILL